MFDTDQKGSECRDNETHSVDSSTKVINFRPRYVEVSDFYKKSWDGDCVGFDLVGACNLLDLIVKLNGRVEVVSLNGFYFEHDDGTPTEHVQVIQGESAPNGTITHFTVHNVKGFRDGTVIKCLNQGILLVPKYNIEDGFNLKQVKLTWQVRYPIS